MEDIHDLELSEKNQELITDITVKGVKKSVLQITDKMKFETMRCAVCPIVLECSYPKRRLDKLREEATEKSQAVYEEEIELDNSAENILRAQQRRDLTYNQYIRDNALKVLGNDRCIFERKEIIDTLTKFVDAGYNLGDPRAFMIVQELVGNILNSGRMNKAFTSYGMLMKKETPAGPIYYQNPLLKSKLDFSRLIIEATEILDKILKSDIEQKTANDFTSHLMKQLKLREAQRKKEKIIDTTDNIIDGKWKSK